MRGLSTSMIVVITIVVLLVVALVVLTIFSGGIGQISSVTDFENSCRAQAQASCAVGTLKMLPPTWYNQVKISGQTTPTSCAQKFGTDCTSVLNAIKATQPTKSG